MLPNITNNRRRALAMGVKLAPIPVAVALLLAGMWATATGTSPQPPRDSTGNVTTHRQTTPAPANNSNNNNFLASLRFWERNKSQPQPRQPNTGAPTAVETRNASRNVLAEQSDIVVSRPSATPGLAPEPPPIPLVEQRGSIRSASQPEWSANFAHGTEGRNAPVPVDGRLSTASHVSYSFDARDWVEFFPHQHVTRPPEVRQPEVQQPEVSQQVAQQTGNEVQIGVIQATSFHTSAQRTTEPFSPVQNTNDGHTEWAESSYWDGQATKLANVASIRNELNRFQQDRPTAPVAVPASAVAPTATAFVPTHVAAPATTVAPPVTRTTHIDLTPSYQSRLPYTQTCGVVVVQANFPLTEIASILEEIDLLQRDLTQYIGVPAPQEKIELCLFKDQKSYMDFLREFFPRAPNNRRALYVKLDNKPGTLMVQQSKDFEVDLRHEMTHAIIHASIPRVPIWLDEGLAKYFEVPPKDRPNNHPYMREIRRSAGLGTIPSLDRLARMDNIDDMDSREYRESWAWTHFMIHRSPETHQLLAAYLQMLATHPSDTGASANLSVATVFTSGRRSSIPSLKLYLDDIMPNQRVAFREHFGAPGR